MDTPAEINNYDLIHKFMFKGFLIGIFIGILVMIPIYYLDQTFFNIKLNNNLLISFK